MSKSKELYPCFHCVDSADFKEKFAEGVSMGLGGAGCRRKGHQFERDVAIWLRKVFPNVRRHLEYQDCEANGVDLVETGLYRIQCKKLKKYASINTINEIQCDPCFGEVPVLVTAGNNEAPMVVLPFSDFVRLLEGQKK